MIGCLEKLSLRQRNENIYLEQLDEKLTLATAAVEMKRRVHVAFQLPEYHMMHDAFVQ